MAPEVTFYGVISDERFEKLKALKLLVCDIDGVFSDGRIYLGNDGEELKAFHTRDGYGIKALVKSGVEVAVITGRESAIVERRMRTLSVKYVIQGQEDKATAMAKLCKDLALVPTQVAAMGDDMPDLGLYEFADTKIAVKDAHPAITREANWITTKPGGYGAVREVCDVILQAHGKLNSIHGASI
ncbi:3-deoxy-manno-octulosonate-8-phosphatase KdsC [Alteromonas pelagimontana]|uniref:3-deoxy-D-manno-octulosonate 8-phosphate phosphatase KdsC n=1 Tax=Alteromonas pelagimontana TaxID=1858656 RepID=A0A6M4MAP6_9ALTE|nr:3-deoxy-manno-octulosonate-8-phosphatase KdsC [Alteromonas pelagimontana]QJR80244.1 3-deoxy-manno-octulosonate-8-phosphatase KdsC [Alteromonas pelagimontana]